MNRSRSGTSQRSSVWRRLGPRYTITLWLGSHLPWLWRQVNKPGLLRTVANDKFINQFVASMEPRPDRRSTKAPYTSWDTLTDRTYSGRHLPSRPSTGHLPSVDRVATLFARSAGRTSDSSTLLFAFFAQWFVDGFLRSDPGNPLRNQSTHQIDLTQLYGPTPQITCLLRKESHGKLKYSRHRGSVYPPLYFLKDGTPDPQFTGLPLISNGSHRVDRKGLTDSPQQDSTPASLDATHVEDSRRSKLFALGLPRANMHYGTAMMSTIFLREHNRLADRLIKENAWDPDHDNERIFQTARSVLIVKLLKIVIEEYINHISPFLFQFRCEPGTGAERRWFRPNWMSIEFDLLYRWHCLFPDTVELVPGETCSAPDLLWDTRPLLRHGVAALIDKASKQPCMQMSLFNTAPFLQAEDARSVKIGRDADLAGYNDYRQACGYPRLQSFADVTSCARLEERLQNLYGSVDNIDFYVGLFAEDVVKHGVLPQLMGTMVGVDAFSQALTNPLLDPRIFSTTTFTEAGMAEIEATSRLADIVRWNVAPGPEPLVTFERR